MSEVSAIEWSINVQKLKQTRAYILCVCKLPDEVRDRLSASDVVKAHGAFILSFSAFPTVGEVFPYQGQFWKVKTIVQFPYRYKTRGDKYPAIAQLEWLSSYESIESVLMQYLNLGGRMKPPKKIQGDQLAIDELLPEAPAIEHKPVKKAFKKQALYRVRKL
jgi:hypothetical protein